MKSVVGRPIGRLLNQNKSMFVELAWLSQQICWWPISIRASESFNRMEIASHTLTQQAMGKGMVFKLDEVEVTRDPLDLEVTVGALKSTSLLVAALVLMRVYQHWPRLTHRPIFSITMSIDFSPL